MSLALLRIQLIIPPMIPGRASAALIPNFHSSDAKALRQVLFDIREGNSNLVKSLGEKSNHAMYQDQNPHRCLLSLQN